MHACLVKSRERTEGQEREERGHREGRWVNREGDDLMNWEGRNEA